MPDLDPHHLLVPPAPPQKQVDRRRFLAQLGLLAGAGAFAPFVHASLPRRVQRIEVARPALGTWVRVVVQDGDAGRANRAAERAFEAIRVVDGQMSIQRKDSQLARVNAAAGRGMAPADPALLDVVERACEAARRTEDVYDPAVLPLMRLYGFYDSGKDCFPTDREISDVLALMGHRRVLIDRVGGRLGLSAPGAAIDLGSIGKGWALDRAIDAIRAEGVHSALVDVGGNVYALGTPEPDAAGWSVGVLHPVTGRIDRTFVLRDMAVATSGNYEQTRILGHVRVGHLFDARHGRPSSGHLSASVTARTGMESDVNSTIAFLLGPDRFRGFPGVVESYFIG
jgi:thiamine biosynthesis lipoprotein